MKTGTHEIAHSLPIELQLMLSILNIDKSSLSLESIQDMAGPHIDWDRFLHLTKEHRLYPIVYAQINKLDLQFVPAHIISTLNQMCVCNTMKMLQLTAVMEKVCHTLEQANIKSLVLKGPVLAEALYDDFSLRTSKDIDLLVPEGSFEQAEELLLQLGFQPDEYVPRALNAVRRNKHHLSYTHSESRVQVELHWRMSSDSFREFTFNELWNRRRQTKKTSIPVSYLGHEDLFVYLISHGARHAWFRLRWLADIKYMMHSEMNWATVADYCGKLDLMHVVGQVMVLLSELFDFSLDSRCRAMAAHAKSQRLADEAIKIIDEYIYLLDKQTPSMAQAYFKSYNSLLLTSRQRWKRNVNKLYPNYLDVKALTLPRWLHFMYFPLRPFLWYWRKKKQRVPV
ncbi:nucleotidyltransferase family protein [Paenibacillus sp. MWE-103]|uniref:Nucleotidyltransferase family protein n=1 Tax=Paenibacillus artemisiicola TaxID=1172618 RepID=A0ABS3WHK4_9BACL|nr:nucleotidyltransferase family protein [Paenibacillus artemisiicola]MBO7747801.1 nucleotidyltransferase family protein [Paenibacillus artemisiicola]